LSPFTENTRPVNQSTYVLMRRLWRDSVRPYLGWLILALFCMAMMAGATALTAWLMKPVVNDVFFAKNRDMLWIVSAAVMATFAIKGLANYGQATLMGYVGLHIIADNQNRLYAHISRLDLTFFHANPTGS